MKLHAFQLAEASSARSNAVRSAEFETEALPHHEGVERFARSLTRDGATAEDLVQDTYLHAFRGFHTFRRGTSCGAWLRRICRNLFIDRVRRQKRSKERVGVDLVEPDQHDTSYEQRQLGQQLDRGSLLAERPAADDRNPRDLEQFGSTESSVAEFPIDDLVSDEVALSLKSLPHEFMRVLLLADLCDLSYSEIHERVGVPVGTVRSRISRGRAMLRNRLADYAGDLGLHAPA